MLLLTNNDVQRLVFEQNFAYNIVMWQLAENKSKIFLKVKKQQQQAA